MGFAGNKTARMDAKGTVDPHSWKPVREELCVRLQFRWAMGQLCGHHDKRTWPSDEVGIRKAVQGLAVMSAGIPVRGSGI